MEEKVQVVSEEMEESCLKILFYVKELNKKISAELSLDQIVKKKSAYQKLINKSSRIIEVLFCDNKIHSIIDDVAIEITESAYDKELKKDEFLKLKKDLSIKGFYFYEDSFLITMFSLNIFPNNAIDVQLDYSLNIEDIVIEL